MKTDMAPVDRQKKWYVVDAEGKTFGRLASQVAAILIGKNKPEYTPNVDTGDYVIVVNASKLVFTGKKLDQKKYYSHSGYPGGLKAVSYTHLDVYKRQLYPSPVPELWASAVRVNPRPLRRRWRPKPQPGQQWNMA